MQEKWQNYEWSELRNSMDSVLFSTLADAIKEFRLLEELEFSLSNIPKVFIKALCYLNKLTMEIKARKYQIVWLSSIPNSDIENLMSKLVRLEDKQKQAFEKVCGSVKIVEEMRGDDCTVQLRPISY
jgi:hypothetical protein